MRITTFQPSDILKRYVKCFWIYASDKESLTEVVYPSGYIELAINISNGDLTTIINDRHIKMPETEVLGQLTLPGKIMTTNETKLLVTRFYPHASSLFFPHKASDFTNDSIDLHDVFHNEASELYNRVMEQDSINQKIAVLECFLIQKLRINEKKLEKVKLVESICHQLENARELFKTEHLSFYYGFSERHIQKLFIQFVGLTPKGFYNIRRFNKSLKLVQSSGLSLTSIAYECEYYDQSHFIKEFKRFTGTTPSQFQHIPIPEQ